MSFLPRRFPPRATQCVIFLDQGFSDREGRGGGDSIRTSNSVNIDVISSYIFTLVSVNMCAHPGLIIQPPVNASLYLILLLYVDVTAVVVVVVVVVESCSYATVWDSAAPAPWMLPGHLLNHDQVLVRV